MSESILYKPRSGEEVSESCGGAPIYLYSDLARAMRKEGAVNVILQLMSRSLKNFILVQDPDNMLSGHWTGLEFNPPEREIYFFSSYGGKPDEEKRKWLPKKARVKSGQNLDVLNDGLKEFAKGGWTIHYSQYPYQKPGDDTATCGIWTSAFMNSGLDPDEFHEQTKRHKRAPEDYYYNRYFK